MVENWLQALGTQMAHFLSDRDRQLVLLVLRLLEIEQEPQVVLADVCLLGGIGQLLGFVDHRRTFLGNTMVAIQEDLAMPQGNLELAPNRVVLLDRFFEEFLALRRILVNLTRKSS